MKRKTDETYLADNGERAICRRCGAELTFTLPMEVGSFARLLKAFVAAHRWCEAPENQTTPAPLAAAATERQRVFGPSEGHL